MSEAENIIKSGRDRELDSSRLSWLINLAVYLALGGFFLVRADFLMTEIATTPEPEPLAIELMDIPVMAPVPEIIPEPEVTPEPQTIAEPLEELQREPEPAPEPEPIPAPKPKPKPKTKKPEAPVREAQKTTPAPAPAKAMAAPKKTNNFISKFTRAVEKSKFYPKAARQAGLTGTVKVRVTFNSQGLITGAYLIPGNYPPALGEAAMTTINKVKSRWAPREGGPAALVVPISFRLK